MDVASVTEMNEPANEGETVSDRDCDCDFDRDREAESELASVLVPMLVFAVLSRVLSLVLTPDR